MNTFREKDLELKEAEVDDKSYPDEPLFKDFGSRFRKSFFGYLVPIPNDTPVCGKRVRK